MLHLLKLGQNIQCNFKVSRSHIIQLDLLCVTVHPKLLHEIPIAMGGQIKINGMIKQEDLCHELFQDSHTHKTVCRMGKLRKSCKIILRSAHS